MFPSMRVVRAVEIYTKHWTAGSSRSAQNRLLKSSESMQDALGKITHHYWLLHRMLGSLQSQPVRRNSNMQVLQGESRMALMQRLSGDLSRAQIDSKRSDIQTIYVAKRRENQARLTVQNDQYKPIKWLDASVYGSTVTVLLLLQTCIVYHAIETGTIGLECQPVTLPEHSPCT